MSNKHDNPRERFAELNREQEKAKEPEGQSKFNSENNEENFKKENWRELNPDERREALQRFENQNADEQGRGRRDIEGRDLPEHVRGQYDHDGNRYEISINNDILNNPNSNPDDAKNAVAHEGRHATQHDVVDGLIDGEQAGIDEEQKEELREDFESEEHLDPHDEHNKGEYMNRASERDARVYAANKSPESNISKEDTQSYEQYDSIARIDAFAQQSGEDFEAHEKGATNQFSPGNAEKGYEEYQQRVTDRLKEINGVGEGKRTSEPQAQTQNKTFENEM